MQNPFPKLTSEVRRHPENKRLLDELGAYLTSLVTKPHNKLYDFYENFEDEKGTLDAVSNDL